MKKHIFAYFLSFAVVFTTEHIIADIAKHVFHSDFFDKPSAHLGFYLSGLILGYMISGYRTDVIEFKNSKTDANINEKSSE